MKPSSNETPLDKLLQGRRLGSAEAIRLERALDASPNNMDLRAKLVGFYSAACERAPLTKHVCWFIENAPQFFAAGVLAFPDLETAKLLESWKRALAIQPSLLEFAFSASRYYPEVAIYVSGLGLQQDPHSVRWSEVRLLALHATEFGSMGDRKAQLNEILVLSRICRQQPSVTPRSLSNIHCLFAGISSALELSDWTEARLLTDAIRHLEPVDSHARAMIAHLVNTVDGLIALADGDATAAEVCLRRSVCDNLLTIEPALAREMLRRGFRNAVDEFIEALSELPFPIPEVRSTIGISK